MTEMEKIKLEDFYRVWIDQFFERHGAIPFFLSEDFPVELVDQMAAEILGYA